MSCGVGCCCGGGGGDGSEAADGVGGPLSPPAPDTACAGNLAVVAMDTLPWLRLPAETSTFENHDMIYLSPPQVHWNLVEESKLARRLSSTRYSYTIKYLFCMGDFNNFLGENYYFYPIIICL